jgi:hypothetical protein
MHPMIESLLDKTSKTWGAVKANMETLLAAVTSMQAFLGWMETEVEAKQRWELAKRRRRPW